MLATRRKVLKIIGFRGVAKIFLLILSLVKTDSIYLLSKKVDFLIDILAQNLHIYVGSSTEKFFEISNSRKKLRIDHPVWR